MQLGGKDAVRTGEEAVGQVDAVGDPRATAAVWKVFAGDANHHGLMVRILSRFKTGKASQMLAALAVYSLDDKARAVAVAALHGREPAEFGERLAELMDPPLLYQGP